MLGQDNAGIMLFERRDQKMFDENKQSGRRKGRVNKASLVSKYSSKAVENVIGQSYLQNEKDYVPSYEFGVDLTTDSEPSRLQ
ncbi:hypothetical protein K0M31_000609 [Melipona bicolor]|uniref:Uncharacterized protein n=1 Tax=Melipona bicolor TaxID=60889 RepID=A0AA40KWZ9_9HYME|nr:hypothetical protein K0M31_000609 [Melipona bicolor]